MMLRGLELLRDSPGINDTPMSRRDEAHHPIMADIINNLIISTVKDVGATALSITHDMTSARRNLRPPLSSFISCTGFVACHAAQMTGPPGFSGVNSNT